MNSNVQNICPTHARQRHEETQAKIKDEKPKDFVGHFVKIAFSAGPKKSEHMWVKVSGANQDDTLVGYLDNDPTWCTHLKCGDKVEFRKDQIEDVLYAH